MMLFQKHLIDLGLNVQLIDTGKDD
jgi:hypothetical protein